eukprot:1156027-Pelagomonas_calceolata.AAC.3
MHMLQLAVLCACTRRVILELLFAGSKNAKQRPLQQRIAAARSNARMLALSVFHRGMLSHHQSCTETIASPLNVSLKGWHRQLVSSVFTEMLAPSVCTISPHQQPQIQGHCALSTTHVLVGACAQSTRSRAHAGTAHKCWQRGTIDHALGEEGEESWELIPPGNKNILATVRP